MVKAVIVVLDRAASRGGASSTRAAPRPGRGSRDYVDTSPCGFGAPRRRSAPFRETASRLAKARRCPTLATPVAPVGRTLNPAASRRRASPRLVLRDARGCGEPTHETPDYRDG